MMIGKLRIEKRIASKIKAKQHLMRVRTNLGIVRIPEKIIKRRKVNRDDHGNQRT